MSHVTQLRNAYKVLAGNVKGEFAEIANPIIAVECPLSAMCKWQGNLHAQGIQGNTLSNSGGEMHPKQPAVIFCIP